MIESIPITKPRNRSETFEKDTESVSPPPIVTPLHPIPSASITRSDTFVSKPESPPPPPPPSIETISSTKPTDIIPSYIENRSDTFISHSEDVPTSIERLPVIETLNQSETIPVKPDVPFTPRISTPRKRSIEGKHPIKAIYSFLHEARRWAEHTRDVTYSNLILATEEIISQIPTRKAGAALRKLPDIDSSILSKAAKDQSPKEVCTTTYF